MFDLRFTINSRPLKGHMSNKEKPTLNKDDIHERSRHVRSTLLGRFTLSYLGPSVGGKKSFLISPRRFPSQIDPLWVELRCHLLLDCNPSVQDSINLCPGRKESHLKSCCCHWKKLHILKVLGPGLVSLRCPSYKLSP